MPIAQVQAVPIKVERAIDNIPVTAEMLESATVAFQSVETCSSPEEKINLGSAACARYIDWAVKEVHRRELTIKQDYRVHWWKVLEKFTESETGRALIQQAPNTKQELDQLTSKLGVEGEVIARFGPELVSLLTGHTDPLTHFLQNDLLFRVYHSDEFVRPNRYMADFVRLNTSQKKNLRILEIGAGTGGTTLPIFQRCSPNGEAFCSKYMYTDVSAGFFQNVRRTTLKKWSYLLQFRTLNLEYDVAEQGFEKYSYDLVIAANVVHATQSLSKSLSTIHQLLKPGGVLGLVEITKATPFYDMVFGSISGWWSGIEEGRTDGPLQSTKQWNEQLQKVGFSGVDLSAYDFPEPERHMALLLSTALPVDAKASGH